MREDAKGNLFAGFRQISQRELARNPLANPTGTPDGAVERVVDMSARRKVHNGVNRFRSQNVRHQISRKNVTVNELKACYDR